MDLGFGEKYDAFRDEVSAFLAESWPPTGEAARGGREEQVRRFRALAVERGYLYRNIPRRYGGSEQPADVLAAQVIREEFGKVRAPVEIPGNGTAMLVPTLLERGEDWQKERFVAGTLSGEIVWAQGYSEPGSGSDLASVRTRGELRGDEWVINGQKIWTTQAHESQYMYALIRTEPEASKHAGITYMLIPLEQPGIEIRPLKQVNGATEFNEVFFTDARTPKDWIVGRRGEGWDVSRTTLKHERNMIGGADRSGHLFASLVRLAKTTLREGRPAIEDPVVRDELVRIEGHVQAQLYSSYVQLSRSVSGRDPGSFPRMTKLISTQIAQQTAGIAHDLLGNDGLATPTAGLGKDGKIGRERWVNQMMLSLAIALGGGTSNIQRNVIAERCLGLPRDEALWKGRAG